MTTSARDLTYEAISVGDAFTFDRTLDRELGERFAELSGDFNPLHVDEGFGRQSRFGKNVAHGMLASSLFSALVGMHLPGRRSLWVSQSLNFRAPAYWGDAVSVRGTVTQKTDSMKLITLRTEIFRGSELLIDGVARVQVLEDKANG